MTVSSRVGQWINGLGHGPMICKTDQEPAIVDLMIASGEGSLRALEDMPAHMRAIGRMGDEDMLAHMRAVRGIDDNEGGVVVFEHFSRRMIQIKRSHKARNQNNPRTDQNNKHGVGRIDWKKGKRAPQHMAWFCRICCRYVQQVPCQ